MRAANSFIDTGIGSEDFDLIPTNQDLYCADFGGNQILKLSHTQFNNYVGDLLITQSGDGGGGGGPELFIVNWNSTSSVFNVRGIPFDEEFEHVTFAPINLPSQ